MATLIVRVPDNDYADFKSRCGSQKKTISDEIRSFVQRPSDRDFLMNLGQRIDVIAEMLTGKLDAYTAGEKMESLHLEFNSMKEEVTDRTIDRMITTNGAEATGGMEHV